jgi:hypothetical protein
VFIAGQKRIVNGYYRQLEDILQILLVFRLFSLEILGLFPDFVKLFTICHKEVLPCENLFKLMIL